jgi:DUF4097 and DUF4098 domain-containing protein YvlB
MSQFTFGVGSQPSLDVRVSSGRLDLAPSKDGQVVIDVSGSGAAYVVVEQDADTVSIREERRGRTVNIRAAIPTGTNLEIAVASLNIVSRVDLGRVVARTASGDIDLGKVDTVEARTASGDVKVDSCTGRCEVIAASGDVRVHQVGGDLSVSTASGDIGIEQTEGRVEVKTASGDIRIGRCSGTSVEATSMSGDVDLGLPEGTRVEAEIDSLSGDVVLPSRRPPGGETEHNLKLRAKTVSGDVVVRRVPR